MANASLERRIEALEGASGVGSDDPGVIVHTAAGWEHFTAEEWAEWQGNHPGENPAMLLPSSPAIAAEQRQEWREKRDQRRKTWRDAVNPQEVGSETD